jgi:hypothetical protein
MRRAATATILDALPLKKAALSLHATLVDADASVELEEPQTQALVAGIVTGSPEDLDHKTVQGQDQPSMQIGGEN